MSKMEVSTGDLSARIIILLLVVVYLSEVVDEEGMG
jgi:hypothetical protein